MDVVTSRGEVESSPRWWNDTNDLIAHIEDDLRGDRAMAIEIPFNDDFGEQMDRTGSHGRSPCIVCGRQCPNPRYMVHVHGGLQTIVTEEEAEQLNNSDESGGDMGMWPIGTDCLKKHPELRPYAQEQVVIKPSDWQKLFFDLYRQTCGNELAREQEVMADAYRRLEILKHHK